MVFDRASEDADGPGEARPELHLHHGRTGGDAHAAPREPPETRSRAECYDALRAADNGSDDGDETKREDPRAADSGSGQDNETKHKDSRAADNRSEQGGNYQSEACDAREGKSGWDAIDAERRPAPDAFHTTPARDKHILDGDGPTKGGGHRHGTGKPDKTEFPQIWDDKHVLRNVVDVARRPDAPPEHQNFNGRWLLYGTREDVKVWAIVLRDGEIWSAWPEEGGPGVVRNPKKAKETP
jgi:Bacterial EndoU nuclease